jgi:signal transduction histidine kinase
MVSAPSEQELRLTPVEFGGLFPFYIAFDARGVITQIGPSLSRLAPGVRPGQLLHDLLQPHRPSQLFDYGNISDSLGRLYTVRERQSQVLLRGEFRRLDGQYLFLGSPWFNDVSELHTHNLKLGDFSVHDPTLDLLQSLQLQKIAASDMQDLSHRLRLSEAFLQSLLDSLPIGVATFDENQRCTFSNCSMNALADSEWLTQLIAHFELRPNSPGAAAAQIFETERKERDKTRHLRAVIFPIHPKNEIDPNRTGLALQDITAEKNLDLELRATAERRREYLELQREFVSMVSHEFRTPLTAIDGALYLLRKALKESGGLPEAVAPRVEKWLGLQAGAVATLKELVDQVLVLNRGEHEKGERMLSPEAPGPLIAKVVQSFNDSLPSPRVEIHDETAAEYTAEMDAGLVKKAVENLISNGLKYSSPKRHVQVRVWQEPEEWAVEVADQGRGIPEADQPRVFKPFFRAGNVFNVPGTGLGLAIVERTVRFHTGYVDFESKQNVGTRFVLRFPRVPPNPNLSTSSRNPFVKSKQP